MSKNRQQMIENVRRFWIDGVLDNSLHGAVLMQLGLQARPDHVHRPWDVKIRRDGDNRQLSADTRIIDVFDLSGGSLLILGEPGSGKTTLLLELTQDLLERAETQPSYRLPIVFNLSSWAQDKLSFDEWLIDELNIKYQVARNVAKQWVDSKSLLLLLDGLDEVSDTVRDDCVSEINAYHQQNPDVPMVVCSRTGDYDALSKKLNFHDAVVIDALDDTQISDYLASFGPTMDGLRAQLKVDKRLRALAETPLTLSIMTLAYQELDTDTLPDDLSMDVQRRHLFDTYVQTMFERHSKSREYEPDEIMGYLSWLAGRMVERRQTLFHIENLQWDWIETRFGQSLYKLFSRTTYGTVIGAISGALAVLVGILLTAGLLGGEVSFYRNYAPIYGLPALLLWAGFGALFGILAGGVPLGLTGLMAYTGERLAIKGQASGYRARTALTSIGISLISSVIGGIFFISMLFMVAYGDFQMYGKHFWEIGASIHQMNGLETVVYLMEISLLTGLIGGIVAVMMAGWWHRRSGRGRQLATGLVGMIFGGFYLLALWVFYFSSPYDAGLQYILFPMLITSLLTGGIGILTGSFRDRIESAERIGWRWSWRGMNIGIAVTLVIIGLDFLSIQMNSGYFSGSFLNRIISIGLPIGTLCVLVGGVVGGLRKSETVESRTEPNQGIRDTVKTALKVTGAFALVGIFIGVVSMVALFGAEFINSGFTFERLSDWQVREIGENLQAGVIFGVSLGLVTGLIFGGTDTLVKHLLLRFMLWGNGDIPANYAKVLDHATNLILLRKVGGGYIFVHRYLLEHFAEIEVETA